MTPAECSSRLTSELAQVLDLSTAESLGAQFGTSDAGPVLLELLLELQEGSPKVGKKVIEAIPRIVESLATSEIALWLDLMVSLTERSGAVALKFSQNSPAVLSALPSLAREPVLRMALELVEQDPSIAVECIRQGGAVFDAVGVEGLRAWSQIGAELAGYNHTLGIEYFRRAPEILAVLPVEDLRLWAGLGGKLVTMNSLGKPDYLAALTYFRTCPDILSSINTPSVRRRVLSLAGMLADRWPALAIQFLAEAPALAGQVQEPAWQERLLQYGMLVAETDGAAALAYLRQAPKVARDRLEEWFKGGMEVLVYSAEAGQAYFAVETRKALEAIEQSGSSVALREVARVLKLFAEALSGRAVFIRSHDDEPIQKHALSQASSEGAVVFLPARIETYPTREQNLLLYKILTAHEAGHLEYGTYDVDVTHLMDIARQACLRYGVEPPASLRSLEDLFHCYPHPLLIKDLWVLAEDARIEACLKAEYPGLRRALESLAREEFSRRSLAHGMSVREIVVELLLRLSSGDTEQVRVPYALEEVVGRAWTLLRSVAQPHATAESVLRVVHRTYVLIEELTASESSSPVEPASPEPAEAPRPRPGETQGGSYRPLSNLAYRGAMESEQVRAFGAQEQDAVPEVAEPPFAHGGEGAESERRLVARAARVLQEAAPGSGPMCVRESQAAREEQTAPRSEEGRGAVRTRGETLSFLYDEWDGRIRDYRLRWCRVVEEESPEGSGAFVESVRSRYGGIIRLIRRYFEGIRPPAFRRVRRQADGEDVDIEAAIEAVVEGQAHISPSESLYIRRDRRLRDVAAVFLVDLSGSTGQQIGADGARIIDVEKEGLVLLCEALEAIGDQYAIYGYSGQSRHEVRFLILKDFDERYGPPVWRRLDAIRPLVQNRDGAAIRHAVHRLMAREARVKLMVLLSDGRPLDDGYADEYALEDTKVALQEARAHGVHPFCITVDQEARGYLTRMYGDVRYLIIDRVQRLPERLPRIYRMLTA